ncbi:MAG: 1-acyl-sn-glycerol-3-phosphate acyltransferase [Myxococcales bacterium]|nr:1-acyl-sn-glycerol-3-phosphate acyltransferase [Myxococcales bacterium]
MLQTLLSGLVWLSFLVLLLTSFVAALPVFALTAWWDRERRALHALVSALTSAWLWAVPLWRLTITHRERLPAGPAILVANHQSMLDILVCLGLRRRFRFVAKAELFRVPLLGQIMTMIGHLPIDRGHTASARRLMPACRARLAQGVSVLFFPEGTYGPGGPLLPFRRGAFQLAVDSGVPLVPIVLRGTRDALPGDALRIRPGHRLSVTILPPITDVGADAHALARRVRGLLEAALAAADPGEDTSKNNGLR